MFSTRKLQLVQACVQASLLDQLVVAALLHQATALEHEDAVRGTDGAEAVRNDESRAAAEQLGERE